MRRENGAATPAMRNTMRKACKTRPGCVRAFHPNPMATCTSATRQRASGSSFELAKEYGGVCHLRFDDTNPEKEEQEYVDNIRDAVKWLGYDTYLADHPSAPNATAARIFRERLL